MSFRLSRLAFAILLAVLAWPATASAEISPNARRIALVIGNSDYASVPALPNASHDATAVAGSLAALGFKVIERRNVAFDGFADALLSFFKEAKQADVALLYFSGHGFQFGKQNYLVPVDADFQGASDVEARNFRLDQIAEELRKSARHTLIFIDACRTNPLPPEIAARDTGSGLASLEAGGGVFVAFATQPGNISADGPGEHSPFTAALLRHMPERGISISDMMIRVRNSVERATKDRQTPWDQSSLRSQFYFNPIEPVDAAPRADPAVGTETTAAVDEGVLGRLIILPVGVERGRLAAGFREQADQPADEQPTVVPTLRIESDAEKPADGKKVAALGGGDEVKDWESIAGSADPADFRRYLDAYPQGSFATVAQLNLDALEKLGEAEKRLKELELAAKAASGTPQALTLEELYWGTIRESELVDDFEAYLRAFPSGSFADLAQARIDGLARSGEIIGALADNGSASRSRLRALAMQRYDKVPTQFLQYGLIALGYPLPKVSGVIDGDTRLSIRQYQASVADPQTGKLTAQQTVDLLLAAAAVGDEHAQTAVGLMMASGQGLQQDYAFARLWLNHAAEQGNPYAQANLAILLRDGLGGSKDVAAARALLKNAADGGLAEAADALSKLRG